MQSLPCPELGPWLVPCLPAALGIDPADVAGLRQSMRPEDTEEEDPGPMRVRVPHELVVPESSRRILRKAMQDFEEADHADWLRFCEGLNALVHAQFCLISDSLTSAYHLFDPAQKVPSSGRGRALSAVWVWGTRSNTHDMMSCTPE